MLVRSWMRDERAMAVVGLAAAHGLGPVEAIVRFAPLLDANREAFAFPTPPHWVAPRRGLEFLAKFAVAVPAPEAWNKQGLNLSIRAAADAASVQEDAEQLLGVLLLAERSVVPVSELLLLLGSNDARRWALTQHERVKRSLLIG